MGMDRQATGSTGRTPDTTVTGVRLIAAVTAVLLLTTAACSGEDDPLDGTAATTVVDPSSLVIASFSATADLSDVGAQGDRAAQGAWVIDQLRTTASTSQADAVALADEAGVASTSYWITNVLVFEGDQALADAVAELPGVATVYVEPIHPSAASADLPAAPAPGDGPTWNVSAVGAPAAWDASPAVTGTSATIGIIDTGIDATHPALASSWQAAGSSWFDATGTCPDDPCDPVGHGTLVAGIAVGGDRDDPTLPGIGVAPGAGVMVARACDDGCSETHLLAALQWMLSPTDASSATGDPGRRPEVLQASWTLARSDSSLDRVPAVLRAAGIVPVFAAGNSGPACGTVGSPAADADAVAVGATDRGGSVDDRSARGPGASGTKPDLVAPGEAIVSSLPGGGYGSGSGTSVAAPHVAGALAVALGDASPDDGALVAALNGSAGPLTADADCEGSAENTAGAGLLDVGALLTEVRSG
jgi:subtilisin family serine protease